VPTALTIYDNQTMSLRRANFANCPPPMPAERRCWNRCHGTAEPVTDEADGLQIQAWSIHEDGWKREIVRTTVMSSF